MQPRWMVLFPLLAVGATLAAAQPPKRSAAVERIVSRISADSIRRTIEHLVSFGTRNSLSDTSGDTRGIGAARRWIRSEFERHARASGGRLSVEFQESVAESSARVPRPTRIVNVLAILRPAGTAGAGRMFLVSGHYDSRASDVLDPASDAPGANDDGSGTALVLELARVMCTVEFRSTVVFAAVAGEEQGLLGSTRLAELARTDSWKLEGVLNNDIVGSSHGGDGRAETSTVRLFSEAYSPLDTGAAFRQRNLLGLENDGGSRTLARYIRETGESYVPGFAVTLIYRRDRFLRGGDHLPFHEQGFPAVRFTETAENFDHQHQNVRTEEGRRYGDLPEFIDPGYCANVARINAAALASLALAPAPPAGVEVLTKNLEYATELHWHRGGEADLAGYRIRYRETTSPAWQFDFFTPDTSARLPASKDDYLFGVQSVDREGNASLTVTPRPRSR